MENQTKYNTAIGVIIVGLLLAAGINLDTDNIYFGTDGIEVTCQPRVCDSLSKVNSNGIQTRCYFFDELENRRYKNCQDGWIKFENIQTEEVKINLSGGEQIYLVCIKTNELISECQIIDRNQTLFKISNQ